MKRKFLTFVSALSVAATGVLATAEAAELRIGYQADVQNLDPLTRREIFTTDIVKSIMEPLVERNADLEIEGALAESWEQLSPTLWRFTLRQGVTYTNGYPFSADDVIATFALAAHAKSLLRPLLAGIADITKVDEFTVDVESHEPYPLLLNELSNMPIFSARWLEENGVTEPVDPASDQDSYTLRNIMGTGPFKLVEYTPGTRTVLEPNPDWWNDADKEHNLTRVEIYPLGQPAARVAALLSGQVDLVFPAPLQDVARIAATPGLKVVESPELRTLHIGMDLVSPELRESDLEGANPFADVRVRQAVYQAIDIDAIVETVMDGHASAVSTVIPAAIGGYDASLDGRLFPYDPDAARALLAEAGYADGFETGFDCPNDRYVNDTAICVAIAGMLARVGIEAHINLLNGARLFPKLEGRESDMWLLGWAGYSTVDAHNFMHQLIVTPSGVRGTYNSGGYSNARVDELEVLIASETDPELRKTMIAEAFLLHKEEIGHIPLHSQTNVWAMRDNIEVVQPAPGHFWLRYITVN